MKYKILLTQLPVAHAAKQSGAGLGGLVLALAPDPRVAATLRAQLDAGGLPSWTVETCR